EQAFGVPFKEANRDSLHITMYRGVHAALFVISERRRKDRIAFAVTARDLDPNQAKYVPTPFLFLENRNLTDVTMKDALRSCEGAVKFADTHSGFAWTPACYFGNPGGHFLINRGRSVAASCCPGCGDDQVTSRQERFMPQPNIDSSRSE